MNKNLRIKVRKFCAITDYDYVICIGKKALFWDKNSYQTIKAAARNAQKASAQTGIPYNPEIIKQHGC